MTSRMSRSGGMPLSASVAVGAALGLADDAVQGALGNVPAGVCGVLVGAAALVGANVPMVVLGITDPRSWSATDWVSDVVPHLAYGLVAGFAYSRSAD